MEIELPSGMLGLADAVLVDLDSLNAHEVDAFGEIVKDYLASLQINHELQVRPSLPPDVPARTCTTP